MFVFVVLVNQTFNSCYKQVKAQKTGIKSLGWKWPLGLANTWAILGFSLSALLTFASIQQSDFEAVPPGFLRVELHSQFRAGSQEGRFHLLSITPIHSSALTEITHQPSDGHLWRLLKISILLLHMTQLLNTFTSIVLVYKITVHYIGNTTVYCYSTTFEGNIGLRTTDSKRNAFIPQTLHSKEIMLLQ